MLYLILAIFCSAMISVLMRLGSAGSEARKPLLAVNYLTCALVSLCFLERGPAPESGGWGVALGLGAVGGVLYLGAFLLLQHNVRQSGVTLSSAFMKLGVIVPTLMGILLFKERLTPFRGAGIALTLAAIVLLSDSGSSARNQGVRLPALVLLMLCGGLADGLSKVYQAWGDPRLEGHFLLFVFGFALLLCAALCAARRQKPTARDWLFGALLGVPNYFSSRFLLLSLSRVPASAAYPIFSCGTLLLAALIGRVAFRERQGRRQLTALAAVLAALVLLNA